MTTTKSLKAIPDLITELKNGNIDAVVTNEAVSLINVKKYDGIKMANTEVGKDVTEGMAAAIKKSDNNKDFIELLNKKIKELQDGKKIDFSCGIMLWIYNRYNYLYGKNIKEQSIKSNIINLY